MSMAVQTSVGGAGARVLRRNSDGRLEWPGWNDASIGGTRRWGHDDKWRYSERQRSHGTGWDHSTWRNHDLQRNHEFWWDHDLQRNHEFWWDPRLSVEVAASGGIAVSGGSTAQGGSTASGGSMGQGANATGGRVATGGIMGSGGRATTTATGGAKATGGTGGNWRQFFGLQQPGWWPGFKYGRLALRQLVRSSATTTRRAIFSRRALCYDGHLRHGPGDGQCDLVRLPNGPEGQFHPSGDQRAHGVRYLVDDGLQGHHRRSHSQNFKVILGYWPTTMANPTT